MSAATAFASAVETFTGTPFRLNGRDRRTGIDCVGLVACALEQIGITVAAPRGYRLRQSSIERMLEAVPEAFREQASTSAAVGDLVLVQPGPSQHHLCVITTADSFVHAHAGLRKVVRQSGPIPWPCLKVWRLSDAG